MAKGRRSNPGEEETLQGRIRMAMAAAGISTPSELARRMKVNRQTVHNWTTGRGDKLTPQMLYALSDALNVNARWLALGPPHSPAKPAFLNPEEHETLQIRRALDSETLDQWLSHGRTLVRLTAKASAANPFGMRKR